MFRLLGSEQTPKSSIVAMHLGWTSDFTDWLSTLLELETDTASITLDLTQPCNPPTQAVVNM